MSQAHLTDLGACIEQLAANGDLARVRSQVDPVHELAGVAYRFEGKEVVLCERVKGHNFPVLIGLYWNRAALARLFGCATDKLPFVVADAVQEWQTRPIEPEVGDSGPANEVVEPEVDLRKLPIPIHALGDGGPYIDSAIVSGKEVYNSVGLVGEAAVYRLVSRQVRGVKAVYFSHGGCGFYHAIVQIKKNMEGTAKNAILATFAAFPSLKMVIAVDEDVDITNAEDVEWALATRFRPETGMIVIPAARGHELNPSTDRGLGTKLGLDATAPYPRPKAFERVKMAKADLSAFDIQR